MTVEASERERCGVTEFGGPPAVQVDVNWICLLRGPGSTPSPGTEEASMLARGEGQ